jgi:hypothetical protein
VITHNTIFKKPQVAGSLIGMSLEEFEKSYTEFELAHITRVSALPDTRRHKQKHQRAVGAGRKHKYILRDRLLMTLFWLRAYTPYEVSRELYDLDKTTVEDNLNFIATQRVQSIL